MIVWLKASWFVLLLGTVVVAVSLLLLIGIIALFPAIPTLLAILAPKQAERLPPLARRARIQPEPWHVGARRADLRRGR